jgi:flagellar biosynthesis/type III secretory pathway protein FliH
MGDSAGFRHSAQQVFICKELQEEAGSWVQGHAEGHTQGLQNGNSTGREKANNVVREIRQEVDDRKSDSQKYRQGIGKKASLVRMVKNYNTRED